MREIDVKRESRVMVENDLLESLLFYATEYPELREEFFINVEIAVHNLIEQLKKELKEGEEE